MNEFVRNGRKKSTRKKVTEDASFYLVLVCLALLMLQSQNISCVYLVSLMVLLRFEFLLAIINIMEIHEMNKENSENV